MPDIFLGEFSTDLLPPDISNQFPSPLSTNVTESTVVSFRATDASGIDLGRLQVSITSVPAVVDGVAQAGFSLTTVAVPQGYDVFVTPASPLPSLFTALVSVTLRDLAPLYNEATYSWQFVTGDTVTPSVVNVAPAPSSTEAPSTSTIEFDVIDDSGMDATSLQLSLDTVPIIVNGIAVSGYSVSYSPVAGGTHVTITPAAPLAGLTVYLVSMTVRDLASPYNETSYAWSFTTADEQDPVVSNQVPADMATGVSEFTTIAFRVTDASGVDIASLDVSLSSSPVIVDGAAVSGYLLSTTPVAGGYDVVITPPAPLPPLTSFSVSVYVRDLATTPNDATYTWSFSTADTISPEIVNRFPTPLSTDVPTSSSLSFDVIDDSGLDTSTLQVSLDSVPVVVNGAAEPGFSVSYAAIPGGTAVIVTPTAPLSSLTAYTVSVTARDFAVPFNESTSSWSFTTADEDAPVVVNQFPAPMSTSVAESTVVSFTALDVSDIDISQLQVTINAALAVENGAANSGYGVSYTPVPGGVDVVVTHATPLPSLSTIIVSVHVVDLAVPENSATYTWSFATGDSINPLVLDPEPGINDVNVSVVLPTSFDVIDPSGSGINLWSLNLSLTDPSTTEDAVVNGVAEPGFLLSLSAIVGGYRATVERAGPLASNTVYTALASVEDLAGNPGSLTWSWTTESGVIETPRLAAVGGDGLVFLSWYVNPLMAVTTFALRRSDFSPPTSPDQGTLVYSGTSTSFTDVNVINGRRYFYTVFVVRYFIGGEPQYVPYDPLASASDVPEALRAATPRIDEYIPLPREFGPTAMPWDGGSIAESWGRALPQGGVRINDLWTLSQGTAIRSPMSGTVTLSSPGAVVVENAAGIRVSVLGQVSPSTGIVSGSVLEAGDALATCVSGSATFDVAKLPSGREGLRTIRPEYFYKTVERRH